jgi:hypothetical protein
MDNFFYTRGHLCKHIRTESANKIIHPGGVQFHVRVIVSDYLPQWLEARLAVSTDRLKTELPGKQT